MCGRNSITTPVEGLRQLFRFAGPLPNLPPRYNVAPTQRVPIVRRAPGNGERELAQVRWGLIPFWAKDEKISYKLINARAEGIAGVEPTFQDLDGRDPLALIASSNLSRRDLKKGQKAMLLAMMYPEPDERGRGKKGQDQKIARK